MCRDWLFQIHKELHLSLVGYDWPSVPTTTSQLGSGGQGGHRSWRLRQGCSLMLGHQADEMCSDSSPQTTLWRVHFHYINIMMAMPLSSPGRSSDTFRRGIQANIPPTPFLCGLHKHSVCLMPSALSCFHLFECGASTISVTFIGRLGPSILKAPV